MKFPRHNALRRPDSFEPGSRNTPSGTTPNRSCFSRPWRTKQMSGRCWKGRRPPGKTPPCPVLMPGNRVTSPVGCKIYRAKLSPADSASASRRPVAPKFRFSVPDLILVPGVAFDLSGHRLGRGKGFYDRLLANARGVKCGVAFDEQIVKAVAAGTHDIRMDFILTPTRVIKT